jgi:osmotically-inducible protein OsmY
MNAAARLGGGLVLGMIIGRFLDPYLGRRRRALVRDKAVSAVHTAGRMADTTSRDLVNRTRGVIASIRSRLLREELTAAVLAERVRAQIGGSVTHPGSIEIAVNDGRVTLQGPILADEVRTAIRRVASVRGVRSVINELEAYEKPGDVPGLQGQGRPRQFGRFELFQPTGPRRPDC